MRWIAELGAALRRFLEHAGNLARMEGLALRGFGRLRLTQLRVVGPVVKAQIRFTGLHALGLVCASGLLLGFVTLLQAYSQLQAFGAERYTGTLLVAVVLRELGPLLTAVLVIGRSGTAIAAELGTMRLNAEVDALEVHGVDPVQFLLVPRKLGVILALFGLMVFLDISALAGGFLVAHFKASMPLGAYLGQVREALTNTDLLVTLLKVFVFGTAVTLQPCYYGLCVRESQTEIPQAVTKAVVSSLLAVFITDALFVTLFYA